MTENKSTEDLLRLGKDDIPTLGVIAAYFVQHLGEASYEEVRLALKKKGCIVHRATLHRALEAMRVKDILAEGHRGGERIYHMKKLAFNNAVEVAHVNPNFVSQLLADPVGEVIHTRLGGLETTNGGRGKGGKPDQRPTSFGLVKAMLEVTSPVLGGHPLDGSPYHMCCYEMSEIKPPRPTDPKEPVLYLERHGTKGIVLNRAVQAGFMTNVLQRAGKSSYDLHYFGFDAAWVVEPKLPIVFMRLPIQRAQAQFTPQGGGAGFGHYEALRVGEVLQWEFMAPLDNFWTDAEFKKALRNGLRFTDRYMSPARGTQYGGAKLLSFEITDRWSRIAKKNEETDAAEDSAIEVPPPPPPPDEETRTEALS